MSQFPNIRMRRLREDPRVRRLVTETYLHPNQLIMPYFLRPGKNQRRPINTMPGIFQLSLDELVKECRQLLKVGVKAVLLFGIPEKKDPEAMAAWQENGIIQQALKVLKQKFPQLLLITDLCLCDYTDHGHCGLVHEIAGEKIIDNDGSLEILSKIAGSFARAGADIIAPSDMMDGRVQRIRDELDAAGFKHLPIMSYAVKYASSFYGPFRDALDSAPAFGDRRSYQMNPANLHEAYREAELDIAEGADILMVKPAMPYLDVLALLKQRYALPLAAYQVSGEFAAIRMAAQQGAFVEKDVVLESWLGMRRAGADLIISYFAKDYAGAIG